MHPCNMTDMGIHMSDAPLKVHITGVYGLIGNLVYGHLQTRGDRYELYGSGRRTAGSYRADAASLIHLPDDRFRLADLADAEAVRAAVEGMDAVLHIGAVPDPGASFEDILQSNVIGTYNVLEACRLAGVRRLVYASSIMASMGYFSYQDPYLAIREQRFEDVPAPIPVIRHTDLPRPTEPYSASKVWGEGICRAYADAHGIATVCLRIGAVNKENRSLLPWTDSLWCSHRDVTRIIELALEATARPCFEICYGVSDNRHRWVDLAPARERLGYVPRDSAEATAALHAEQGGS